MKGGVKVRAFLRCAKAAQTDVKRSAVVNAVSAQAVIRETKGEKRGRQRKKRKHSSKTLLSLLFSLTLLFSLFLYPQKKLRSALHCQCMHACNFAREKKSERERKAAYAPCRRRHRA